jgi:steroid delta-isomerase-like uncharacterized protein
MSEAENKTIAQRFNEDVWGRGDEAALEELLDSDFVDHDALPGQPPDREGHKQILAVFRGAFPDLNVTTEDMVAEGDKVVTRWTARGTHQGDLMGLAPTGREVRIKGIDVLRIAGGRIVERWAEYNDLEVMQQLGAVPEPGQEEGVEPSH